MTYKKIQSRALGSISIISLAIIGIFLLGAGENKEALPETPARKDKPYQITSVSIPKSASFAGEKVPLNRVDIRERLDRELLSNSYFHSNTILLIKRANIYFKQIEKILKEENVPEDFKYLALIESSLDPIAYSPAGAAGFWQFLKTTGKEYGLEVNTEIDERYNFEKSTRAACKYFHKSYEKFGSWSLVAASYNIGQRRISTELERQAVDNYYDLYLVSETSRYVFRILAIKEILKAPQKFGFKINKKDLYPSIAFEQIKINSSVTSFGEFAKKHGISYGILKKYNPWLRDGFLTNSRKKTYTLQIPKKGSLEYNVRNIKVYQSNWVVNP